MILVLLTLKLIQNACKLFVLLRKHEYMPFILFAKIFIEIYKNNDTYIVILRKTWYFSIRPISFLIPLNLGHILFNSYSELQIFTEFDF